mmetsp:Transcript_7443/g.16437  ORF Transcript_7443/g.16437 Transcript_7443/m.16437 type:complete len:261 (-) Transcript_7443:5-787(-)
MHHAELRQLLILDAEILRLAIHLLLERKVLQLLVAQPLLRLSFALLVALLFGEILLEKSRFGQSLLLGNILVSLDTEHVHLLSQPLTLFEVHSPCRNLPLRLVDRKFGNLCGRLCCKLQPARTSHLGHLQAFDDPMESALFAVGVHEGGVESEESIKLIVGVLHLQSILSIQAIELHGDRACFVVVIDGDERELAVEDLRLLVHEGPQLLLLMPAILNHPFGQPSGGWLSVLAGRLTGSGFAYLLQPSLGWQHRLSQKDD